MKVLVIQRQVVGQGPSQLSDRTRALSELLDTVKDLYQFAEEALGEDKICLRVYEQYCQELAQMDRMIHDGIANANNASTA